MEILSRSTWHKDIGIGAQIAAKMRHYRRIGVREYWIYNPEWLQAKQGLVLFRGFRLRGMSYTPIKLRGRYWPSAVLGTRWVVGDIQRTERGETFPLMRLCRPQSTDWYPTADEKNEALAKALAEKDEALTLLAQYRQRFGSLEDDAPSPRP